MRQLPRIQVARLGEITDLVPTAAVVAMLGSAALVDEVLLPDRNVAIIFLIPMLVAVFVSSTWLAALAAALAILDYWTNVSRGERPDRKSTRLNSSHLGISYAVFCLKKKKEINENLK